MKLLQVDMKALEVARMDQNKQKMPYFHCDPWSSRRESISDRKYTNKNENKKANTWKQILEYYPKTKWMCNKQNEINHWEG